MGGGVPGGAGRLSFRLCRVPRVLLGAQEHAQCGRGSPLGAGAAAAHPGALRQLQTRHASVSNWVLVGFGLRVLLWNSECWRNAAHSARAGKSSSFLRMLSSRPASQSVWAVTRKYHRPVGLRTSETFLSLGAGKVQGPRAGRSRSGEGPPGFTGGRLLTVSSSVGRCRGPLWSLFLLGGWSLHEGSPLVA